MEKNISIASVSKDLEAGSRTVRDIVDTALSVIKEEDSKYHAYLGLSEDIDAQIARAEELIQGGKATALTGMPFAYKDNLVRSGELMTAGSKILEGYRAPYTATAIKNLEEQGVIFVGRTNMDEFAMGSSTENSAYGVTKNPLDPTRVPGGTSGGSAAALRMGGVVAALGSDTGGSVRQPAAFTGLVGLKPTYGRVSRYGLTSAGSSFDQIGPITRTPEEALLIMKAMAGVDPQDSTTRTFTSRETHTKRIGVPTTFMKEGLDPDVKEVFQASLEKYRSAGYEIVDVELPHIEAALAVYYILIFAEESSNLSRFDGVRYGPRSEGANLLEQYMNTRGSLFGPEPRRRIMLGTYVLSAGYFDAFYGKATSVRDAIRKGAISVLEGVDAILTPTTPTPPFRIGEKADPLSLYLGDVFTVLASLTGMPAISVPMGTVVRDGVDLPLGLQLMGAHGDEDTIVALSDLARDTRWEA